MGHRFVLPDIHRVSFIIRTSGWQATTLTYVHRINSAFYTMFDLADRMLPPNRDSANFYLHVVWKQVRSLAGAFTYEKYNPLFWSIYPIIPENQVRKEQHAKHTVEPEPVTKIPIDGKRVKRVSLAAHYNVFFS